MYYCVNSVKKALIKDKNPHTRPDFNPYSFKIQLSLYKVRYTMNTTITVFLII